MMKKLFVILLILAVSYMPITARAVENNEQPSSDNFTVQTLDELQDAISVASDGDEILVTGQICFEAGEYYVGSPDKTITLVYDEQMSEQTLFLMGAGTTKIVLQNLSLRGNGLNYDTVLQMTNSDQEVTLNDVSVQGFCCHLYPICNIGTMAVNGCTFETNSGRLAGHIKNEQGTLTVSNSYFSDGISETAGGAIQNFATLKVDNSVFRHNIGYYGGAISTRVLCEVNNSSFTENIARCNGGAFINNPDDSSVLILTDCEIYGNSAEYYGDDICNEQDMTIQYTKTLLDVYTSSGRVPHGWQDDGLCGESNECAKTEYPIPIITSRENDGTLYIRFIFEDEVITKDEDDTVDSGTESPTEPSEETDKNTPVIPDYTETAPVIPPETTDEDDPVAPDSTKEQQIIPDTTDTPASFTEEIIDTTPTTANIPDSERPATPERPDASTSSEEISSDNVPNETDDDTLSSAAATTDNISFIQDVLNDINHKYDAITSILKEINEKQGYADLMSDENGNTSSGESEANVYSKTEDAVCDTATESRSGSEPIELNHAASESEDNAWEKVNRIALFILIISLIELGVLLVIFIYWLKRVRK